MLLSASLSHRRPFPPSSTCSACSCSHRQFFCSSGCQLGWWEARPGGYRGSWQPLGSEGPTGQLPTASTRQPCCFLSPAVLTTMWETGCLGKHVSMLTVPESGTAEVGHGTVRLSSDEGSLIFLTWWQRWGRNLIFPVFL